MKNKVTTKSIFGILAVLSLALLATMPALAEGQTGKKVHPVNTAIYAGKKMTPAIVGSVTAINGNIITLAGKNSTTYTINATTAKIKKAGTTVPLSSILVGDSLVARGTLTGTNVVATSIMDGLPAMKNKNKESEAKEYKAEMSRGTVTAINGSNFTMQAKTKTGTTTITVTTTGTTVFKKDKATATLSDLAIGQNVTVKGVKDSSNNIASATNINIMTVKPTGKPIKGNAWGKIRGNKSYNRNK